MRALTRSRPSCAITRVRIASLSDNELTSIEVQPISAKSGEFAATHACGGAELQDRGEARVVHVGSAQEAKQLIELGRPGRLLALPALGQLKPLDRVGRHFRSRFPHLYAPLNTARALFIRSKRRSGELGPGAVSWL